MGGLDHAHDMVNSMRISGRSTRIDSPQTILGLGALSLCLLIGARLVESPQFDTTLGSDPSAPQQQATLEPAAPSVLDPAAFGGKLVDLRAHATGSVASLSFDAPLRRATSNAAPETQAPTRATAENAVTADAPLPPVKPAEFALAQREPPIDYRSRQTTRMARQSLPPTMAPSVDNRSIIEKIFGGAPQATGPALAYASPEASAPSGILGGRSAATAAVGPRVNAATDRYTAVYDISAHTVYMPNGQRLEAHSGLRERLDDPRFVHEKMRGATPPNLYELTPREQLFHGVQALRLNPVGGTTFGRAGLLAHTYMLGPNGDSNGCVSFRDYAAFLRAYQNGEVRRLAVVARMN